MKAKNILHFLVKYQIVQIIINLAFLVGVLAICRKFFSSPGSYLDLVDISIFLSFILVTMVHIASNSIEKGILNRMEDSSKLTTDYRKLIKAYKFKTVQTGAGVNEERPEEKNFAGADHLSKSGRRRTKAACASGNLCGRPVSAPY